MAILLGIETSCDDTCAAVQNGKDLLGHVKSTQAGHEAYGGVIPELASRAHQANIIPVVEQALKKSGIQKKDLDVIAFTQGPGLLGALMVGHSFARTLSLALNCNLQAVNHLHAHHLSHFVEHPVPSFPFLNLLVSGGHAQIAKINSPLSFEVIGGTIDDAAGEALDKAAQMLGLPYPGGPAIDEQAQYGNPSAFQFPLSNVKGYNFSFSGLKTSLLYFLRDQLKHDPAFIQYNLADLCASYLQAVVSTLLTKLKKAVHDYNIRSVGIAGGVAANQFLRVQLKELAYQHSWEIYAPSMAYCTDNAAMINQVAFHQFQAGQEASQQVTPFSR
jgi:N6-L-threonylcarbamoyladenine synthase